MKAYLIFRELRVNFIQVPLRLAGEHTFSREQAAAAFQVRDHPVQVYLRVLYHGIRQVLPAGPGTDLCRHRLTDWFRCALHQV